MNAPTPLTPALLWSLARLGAPCDAGPTHTLVPVRRYAMDSGEATDELVLAGVEPRVVTEAGTHAKHPCVRDGKLAYIAPAEGRPAQQVHVLSLSGGEARCVSDFPLGASDPRWLPDGRLVVVAPVYAEAPTLALTRARVQALAAQKHSAHVAESRIYRFWDRWVDEGQVPHLFELEPDTGEARDLTPTLRHHWDFMEDRGQYDFSPDGTQLVFAANLTPAPTNELRSAVWLVDRATLELTCLTHDHPGESLRPRFSPDGLSVVYGQRATPRYSARVALVRHWLRSERRDALTAEWDLSPSEWLVLEDRVVGIVEHCAHRRLFELREGTPPRLLETGGSFSQLASTPSGLVALHDSLSHPPRLVNVEPVLTRDEPRIVLFDPNAGALEGIDMGSSDEQFFEGSEGERVQHLLVFPPGFDRTKRWPLVQVIHGGPYGISAQGWHWRWNAQLFAAQGYVVSQVNFHGSSSFGSAFADAIHGNWGGAPARDVERSTDALLAQGFVDPARVAVAGGSYGGYLAAWLASQSKRYACAVVHAGVFNLTAMYASDVTEGRARDLGGLPWGAQREQFITWDTSSHMDDYTAPTLVLHGERDYRVPAAQGLELYGMLQERKVPSRLVYYPDENHWILKLHNSLHWYGEVGAWLERWVGPGPS